ncbi:MAG TPA: peptide ABC transporter substrate-binding protein, partial [Candidatus Dormibacteraeota bacterium]|nr:peptide ABC transporter substrate-binding protein [Candidatus Dormibacteraeota bacterium]
NKMDITIQLKSGMKWSDGTPITTQDIKWTWQQECNPASGAVTAPGFDQVQDMQILSPTKMVWQMGPVPAGNCQAPNAINTGVLGPYLLDMNMSPLPEHVLGSIPVANWKNAPFFTNYPTVTDGAYVVTSFTGGNNTVVTYKPNPYYADGRTGAKYFNHKAYLSRLVYKTYGDKSSELAGIRTSDTQIGQDLLGSDISATKGLKNIKTVVSYPPSYEMVLFNQGNNETGCASQQFAQTCGKPTVFKDDPVLRQALNIAVDKQAMIKSLVGGVGKIMNSVFPDNLKPWYDTNLPAWKLDVAKANSMLTSDGWKMTKSGVREKNGRMLEFTLSTTSGNPQRSAEEEQLQHDWGQVGAKVTNFTNFPADQFFGDFGENGTMATGTFDAGIFTDEFGADPDSWSTLVTPSQLPSTANPGGQNWGRVNDPTMTKLFTEGELTASASQRQKVYDQLQVEWNKNLPLISLYQRPNVATAASSVVNFAPGGPGSGAFVGLDFWNAADYGMKPAAS